MLEISMGVLTHCSEEQAGQIDIPHNVTSIGNHAFEGCASVTAVTIPDSVTSIGRRAFAGCTGLQSITIPSSVTLIEDFTFDGCECLTSVEMPTNLKSIGDNAFENCRQLRSITIPEGVTSIGEAAFADCTDLQSITIPSSVRSIDSMAFDGCTNVTQVKFDKSAANIPASDGLTLLDRVICSEPPDNIIRAMIFAGASFTETGLAQVSADLRDRVISWSNEYRILKDCQRATLYERAFEIFYAHQCETAGYAEPTNISSLPNELWFQILGLDANSHPEFPLLTNDDLRNIANQSVADAAARLKESIAAQYKRALKNSVLYRYQNHGLHCLSQLDQQQADEARWHDWKQAGGSTAMVARHRRHSKKPVPY